MLLFRDEEYGSAWCPYRQGCAHRSCEPRRAECRRRFDCDGEPCSRYRSQDLTWVPCAHVMMYSSIRADFIVLTIAWLVILRCRRSRDDTCCLLYTSDAADDLLCVDLG